MADPQSTSPVARPASEIDYKPISGLAAAAAIVSAIFLVVVVFIAWFAQLKKRPALDIYPLFIAGLGLVLAIAGRAHIRRSEGTRAGLKAVNAAWWISVIGGAAYAAYLLASVFALRQQSQKAALEWFDLLKQRKFNHAFLMTLDPTRRQNVNPDNELEVEAQFGAIQLPGFRNSEVVRFFRRNGNEVEVESLGVGNWRQVQTGYQVETSFRLKCAEGIFDINLVMIGSEGADVVGRDWHVAFTESGLVTQTRTSYGRLLFELAAEAHRFAEGWRETVLLKKLPSLAYLDTLPQVDRLPYQAIGQSLLPLCYQPPNPFDGLGPLSGPLGVFPADTFVLAAIQGAADKNGSPNFISSELIRRGVFQIDGGGPLTEDMKKRFHDTWRVAIITPAGSNRLQNSDTSPEFTLTATEILYTYPVEIGLPGQPITFAKGRVILAATSPELVRRMNELKAQGKANPGLPDANPAADVLALLPAREWRIVRIETNLEPLSAQQRPGGGPGGPGGGPEAVPVGPVPSAGP
jgi:hypothetical protein